MNFKKINEETYDIVSEEWDNKRQYEWEQIVNFLKSISNNSSLLDLGCGAGRHLETALKLDFKKENILGSDQSQNQLNIVKEKGFKTKKADLINLPFENSSYDNIICIAAHHHLLDPKEQLKSLEEIKRVLKNNGKVLISNWFPTKEYVKKQLEKNKFQFLDEKKQKVRVTFTFENKKYDRYYYLFKEEELIELCKNANLEIESKEYNKGNLYLILR